MNNNWKGNAFWLVCLGKLLLLAIQVTPPGCVAVRDEEGKPILWACRFPGADLGPALIFLFAMLPFWFELLMRTRCRIPLTTAMKGLSLLIAWSLYVRYDVQSLGVEGIAYLLERAWPLYTAVLVAASAAAVAWNRRSSTCRCPSN